MGRQREALLAGTVGSSENIVSRGVASRTASNTPQLVAPALLQGPMDVLFHRCDLVRVGLALAYVAIADRIDPLPCHCLRVGHYGHRGFIVFTNGFPIQQHMHHRLRQLELHSGRGTVGHDGTENHHRIAGRQPVLYRDFRPRCACPALFPGKVDGPPERLPWHHPTSRRGHPGPPPA